MADCDLFNFVVWGVIGSVLCFFGFVGNSLSLVTFQKDRRSPATTVLQCLASSDFMLLLSVFMTDGLPYICDFSKLCDNPWRTWPYIRYIWLLTPISHMCSIWFVVLIAMNRYFAVCHPHKVNIVWDNRKTPIYVTTVLVLVIVFNLPRFFEYQIVEFTNPVTNATYIKEMKTEFGQATVYQIAYKMLLVNILLIMVPIMSLIVFTLLIWLGLRKRNTRLKAKRTASSRATTTTTLLKGRANPSHDITFILVVVVIVAILCKISLAAFHFVRYSKTYYCGYVVYYLDNISKLLVNVNSCVNFIIYCVGSPRFRGVLFLVVTCRPTTVSEHSHKSSSYRAEVIRNNGAIASTNPEETDV